MLCALHLFATQGYAKTSIRQICAAADVNISAISYYFKDKAGLYRAAFTEPCEGMKRMPTEMGSREHMPFETILQYIIEDLLAPFSMGEIVQDVMQLHSREMIEPTGVWKDEIENQIKPRHMQLVRMLSNELGLEQPDDDVLRLSIAIVGMVLHFFIGQDVVKEIAPQLCKGEAAIAQLATRLHGFAMAMIASEKQRRQLAAASHQQASCTKVMNGTSNDFND